MDAFSLLLARRISQMAPVEDDHSTVGQTRAARYELCVGVRFRIGDDPIWKRGMTANVSRSGILVYTREIGALPPQPRTDPISAEVVIELGTPDEVSLVRCEATVARLVPARGDALSAMAFTVGDYVLLAS